MPKITEFPKLRTHCWTDKTGQRRAAYYYCMRNTGKPDVALGTDLEQAKEKWRILVSGGTVPPLVKAKAKPKLKAEKRLKPLSQNKRRKFQPGTWADLPLWAKRMYLSAERRSSDRGWAAFLSVEEFKRIVARSAGHCELTCLPLDCEGEGRRPMAPSIDRIDSQKGYVADNVRVVCLMANQAMSEWGAEPVIKMAQALAQTS